jgi:hypothetical protein
LGKNAQKKTTRIRLTFTHTGALHRHQSGDISLGMKLAGVAALTLIALILVVWANVTFHPVGGNIMPWIVLGLGIVSAIGLIVEALQS